MRSKEVDRAAADFIRGVAFRDPAHRAIAFGAFGIPLTDAKGSAGAAQGRAAPGPAKAAALAADQPDFRIDVTRDGNGLISSMHAVRLRPKET